MVARSENLDRTVANLSEKLDQTVEETAAKKVDQTVEDKAANCLMLLSRVGEGGGRQEKSRVYRCKTCMKEFSSFQSLGGHRASHNKHVDEKSSLSSGSVAKKKTTNTRSHRCPICGVEFPMGQALGGHMRKHRNEEETRGALVTRSFFPEAETAMMISALTKSTSGKRVACLDFGSDSMESMINLELELGNSMY
ncbi:hypothetical protein Bca4012_020613 [Brassica carinata]|uniref:C2H2-type domain-containing protein n=1 Tax=Brassica carinata TaxID=52824 RepID=A0A8X7WJD5_BRACI|nr:hypothetical protein Bca52824_001045 [Brassica carinata]